MAAKEDENMLKQRLIRLLTVVFIICLLAASCIPSYSQPDFNIPPFSAESYKRDEACNRAFPHIFTEALSIGIGFERDLYTESDAEFYAGEILNDLYALCGALSVPKPEKLALYVLNDTDCGAGYVSGNKLFCTRQEFESGSYRRLLVKLALQTDSEWVACGLSGLVFEEKPDVESLKEYYCTAENINVLGLSPIRFSLFWNTAKELKIAEQTAVSLAGYVLEQHGLDVLLSGIDDKIKTDWMRSIGVQREFSFAYGDILDGFSYSLSKDYPLIAECDSIIYYLRPTNCNPGYDLKTAEDVERHLYRTTKSRYSEIDYIKNNAGGSLESSNTELQAKYYQNSEYRSKCYTLGQAIYMNPNLYYASHEIAHALLYNPGAPYFMTEGLADYLSIIACDDEYWLDFYKQDIEMAQSGGDLEECYLLAYEYYTKHGGPTDASIDARLYYDAYTYGGIEAGTVTNTHMIDPIYKAYGFEKKDASFGDELTYYQAGSFVSYLCDTYGFDRVLDYYFKTPPIKDAFQKDYEILKADWLDYLYREYPAG